MPLSSKPLWSVWASLGRTVNYNSQRAVVRVGRDDARGHILYQASRQVRCMASNTLMVLDRPSSIHLAYIRFSYTADCYFGGCVFALLLCLFLIPTTC